MESISELVLSHFKRNAQDGFCVKENLSDHNMKVAVVESESKDTDEDLQEERTDPEDEFYHNLIISLTSVVPEREKGHFWSLSNVYKCSYCRKLIPFDISNQVACLNGRFTVNPLGDVVSSHAQADNWDITQHVDKLKRFYRCNWKRIYWRLRSECHYLFCFSCDSYYPLVESNSCHRHEKEALFTFLDEEGVSTRMHPIGWFTCCKAKAYRYESVQVMRHISCNKILSHTVQPSNLLECGNIKTKSDNSISDVAKSIRFDKHRSTGDHWCEGSIGVKGNVTKYCLQLGSIIERGLFAVKPIEQTASTGKGDACEPHHPLRPIDWKHSDVMSRRNNNALITFMNANYKSNLADCEVSRSKTNPIKGSGNDVLCVEGCCLPMQEINVQDKYFNRPIRYSKRSQKHKRTSKCGLQSDQWVNQFSTRYNQDRQRQFEDCFFNCLNPVLSMRAEEVKQSKGELVPANDTEHSSDTDVTSKDSVDCICDLDDNDTSDGEICDSLSSYCNTLNSSVRVRHSRKTSVWNSYAPLAGSYIRIETEFRETCLEGHVAEEDNDGCVAEKVDKCKSNQLLEKLNERVLVKTHRQPTFTIQHYNQKLPTANKWWLKSDVSTVPNVLASKRKELQIPLLTDKNSEHMSSNIWSFDSHSQELDYMSAAYKPLPLTFNTKHYKHLKPIRNLLSNEWSDLIDLEKSWSAFLRLFFESESVPRDKYNACKSNTHPAKELS